MDIWASPELSNKPKLGVSCTFVLPICLYGCETWAWTEVQMGRLEITHSKCLRRIVGMKLTDRNRLETIREQCSTSSQSRWFVDGPVSGWGTYCE
eukprot:365566-Chlamydomonas_euryale.AAC.2